MNKIEEEAFKKQGFLKLSDSMIVSHDDLQWVVITDPKMNKATTGNFGNIIKGERMYFSNLADVFWSVWEKTEVDVIHRRKDFDVTDMGKYFVEVFKKCSNSARKYTELCKETHALMQVKVCESCKKDFKVKREVDADPEDVVEATPKKKKVAAKKVTHKKKVVSSRKKKSAISK